MSAVKWVGGLVAALVAIPASAQERLTLDQAVARALEQNPSIASGQQAVSAADARVTQSIVGILPQLIVSLGYQRRTMNAPLSPTMQLPAEFEAFKDAMAPDDLGKSYDNFSGGVTLTHPIWDWGRTVNSHSAAVDNRTAAKEDLVATREQVRLNTTLAYYLVLAAREADGVAIETVRQMEEHLKVAKAQAQAGTRQRIDVTRAEADLAQARLNRSKAQNGIRLAEIQLATTMGSETGSWTLERPANGQGDDGELDRLVQDALERRPEFKALKLRESALGSQVDVANSNYFPNLALQAGLSWQGYELKSEVLPPHYMNWFAGVSLQWNALTPIAVSAASDEIKALARQLKAERRNLELGIRAEVESAALSLEEAKQRIEPATALEKTATETLRLAETRYGAGAGSIVEVTDAQAIYTQARLGMIQAEFDIETARARLQRAIGAYAN